MSHPGLWVVEQEMKNEEVVLQAPAAPTAPPLDRSEGQSAHTPDQTNYEEPMASCPIHLDT